MRLYKKILLIFIITTLNSAFAVDQAAKEETTPPEAAGALTADQIPPVSSTLPAKEGAVVQSPKSDASTTEANQ
ncbi:MAG: hypothetical protein K0S63_702 [Gammaproteobacteria bacterium]|jgi:hypothetical protein|nr:hypothetical protein [Gammaproteobacteria bacterium]